MRKLARGVEVTWLECGRPRTGTPATQAPNFPSPEDSVEAGPNQGDEMNRWGPRSLGLPLSHLGSSCDRSIGGQVQAPLAHPHHGLIALVSGLSDVLVDLLEGSEGSKEEVRAGPLGQALPCSRSHLGKALPAAEGHFRPWEGQECTWLQAQGCLGLGRAGKQSGSKPSPCWTVSGARTCGRARWSPWYKGTAAISQRRSSAQSRRGTCCGDRGKAGAGSQEVR